MKLSSPVYSLKRKAKEYARTHCIDLTKALDIVARGEGFNNWSLLAARLSSTNPAKILLSSLEHGDLVLVGARPGHGKTLLSLELIVRAIESGENGYFFTLEWNVSDILKRLSIIGTDVKSLDGKFQFDNSEHINAEYIINNLDSAKHGTLVAIDYLQLLDQRIGNPDLGTQIQMLSNFAKQRKLIIVMVSQIKRDFEQSGKPYPELEHVRKLSPMDLRHFDKTCFLNSGEIQISTVG